MARDIDKVRRKLNKKRRKREWTRDRGREGAPSHGFYPHHPEAPYHEPEFYNWREREKSVEMPKTQGSGTWVLQSLIAAALFLLIGILFQSAHPAFDGARQYIQTSFEKEFPFAQATTWYEERFGSPLAFLPFEDTLERPPAEPAAEEPKPYAIPVNAVTETFSENGKGVILETGRDQNIQAIRGGVIVHAGPHEEWDMAVAVQHYDGGEAWYGLMEQVSVKVYDHVSSGTVLGQAATDEENGRFSLAIKEDDTYIDPMEVISFD